MSSAAQKFLGEKLICLFTLQGKIQGLKKTASKGDKKKKKDVVDEIAKLETELNAKHEKELEEFKKNSAGISSTETPVENDSEVEKITGQLEEVVDMKENNKKVSKAQKRRDKKAEKERDRLEDIERQEEENKHGLRHIESDKIKSILTSRDLKICEIPSNGDCLFAGIAHQLKNGLKVSDLRKMVAETLLSNKDDYQPFLSLDDEGFKDYCEKMASTPKWGGQVEITALSKSLKTPIEVIQADGPLVEVGKDEHADKSPIILTYHRHYFGLGEHYNSVTSSLSS